MASNGEQAVKSIMETHFISPTALAVLLRDPFTPEDFEEFINERQKTLLNAIESLLVKERIDLPPDLRLLDENIEQVELRLRQKIAHTLGGDEGAIPPHILQKIDGRLQAATKKNPAFDSEKYASLNNKLEFANRIASSRSRNIRFLKFSNSARFRRS